MRAASRGSGVSLAGAAARHTARARARRFMLDFDMARMYEKRVRDYNDGAAPQQRAYVGLHKQCDMSVGAAVRPNGGFTEIAPSVGIADASLGGGAGPVGNFVHGDAVHVLAVSCH